MIKRNLSLLITLVVFLLGYGFCLTQFPSFSPEVYFPAMDSR